ncbi:hypothetical protein HanIR_Chr15g0758391 [Helianthus annuus]|nr:hypothetical protein HanIR_Chr15g0758391 [Helianthus annuus]
MKTKLFDTLTKLNLTPCRTYCTVIGAIGKNLLASPTSKLAGEHVSLPELKPGKPADAVATLTVSSSEVL